MGSHAQRVNSKNKFCRTKLNYVVSVFVLLAFWSCFNSRWNDIIAANIISWTQWKVVNDTIHASPQPMHIATNVLGSTGSCTKPATTSIRTYVHRFSSNWLALLFFSALDIFRHGNATRRNSNKEKSQGDSCRWTWITLCFRFTELRAISIQFSH